MLQRKEESLGWENADANQRKESGSRSGCLFAKNKRENRTFGARAEGKTWQRQQVRHRRSLARRTGRQ